MNKSELEQNKGKVIDHLTCTVTKLWPRKSGTTNNRNWSVQSGDIKLTNGESVAITIWGKDDCSHLVGKTVTFHSVEGDKGLNGVEIGEIKKGTRAGNLEVVISAASIEQGATAASPASAPARPAAPAPSRGAPAPTGHLQSVDAILDLYNLCYGKVVSSSPEEERTDREHMRQITACIFIEANRKGITQ